MATSIVSNSLSLSRIQQEWKKANKCNVYADDSLVNCYFIFTNFLTSNKVYTSSYYEKVIYISNYFDCYFIRFLGFFVCDLIGVKSVN